MLEIRGAMTKLIKISNLSDFIILENQLTNRWLTLQKESDAFQYKLNIQKQKSLGGKLNFLVQVRNSKLTHHLINMFQLCHPAVFFSTNSIDFVEK